MDQAAQRLTIGQDRGSGRHTHAAEPRYLVVGEVLGAHGVRGELKVEILTDDPHRFGLLERVFLGLNDEEPVPRAVKGYRLHKGRVLLRLQGCDDRAMAQGLRGYLLQIPREEALPLEDGEYFEHQILGLEVWAVSGERLGEVAEIIYTGANEVFVVRRTDPQEREILIPAIEGVLVQVDLGMGRLIVDLPEGLG